MYKVLIVFFITIFVYKESNSQEMNADSLQRLIMKDSLSITDLKVDSIFAIRNHFLQTSLSISNDSVMTDQQKETALGALISQTNNGILQILGSVKFEQYTNMIRRRMQNRPRLNNTQPLAN